MKVILIVALIRFHVIKVIAVITLILCSHQHVIVMIQLNRTIIFFSFSSSSDDALALTLVLRPPPLTHVSSPYENPYL